jgi:hypothetical protein
MHSRCILWFLQQRKLRQREKEAIEPFDFKPLNKVKASFLEAGYPEVEINDMIEAMSELPQYAVKKKPKLALSFLVDMRD